MKNDLPRSMHVTVLRSGGAQEGNGEKSGSVREVGGWRFTAGHETETLLLN